MKTKLLAILVVLFAFSACNDDDDIKTVSLDFSVKLPVSVADKNPKIEQGTLTLENVNTGQKIVRSFTSLALPEFTVEDGVYNMKVVAEITYATTDKSKENPKAYEVKREVRGTMENAEIHNGKFSTKLPLFFYNPSESFVISEIFFSWTKAAKDKRPYTNDQFFELYNNSDKVLYADGLCIGETALKTAHINENFSPDIRNEAVPLRTVYRIPGSGKEHPVQPGETFVFCDLAINHKEINPQSVDLSKADFEWYDNNKRDVDIPEVPNMERVVVKYAKAVWKLFSIGQHSYVLFRVPNTVSAEQFAEKQAFHYEFTLREKTYSSNVWKIENAKVIDAVECSTPSAFEWKAMSSELDLTWTHSGDADNARYGHSVKRKISHKIGERIVLQDTNDSATDFIATAPNPSPGTVADHK